MSDEQLRELERRFRASGSAEDEAAWLRARVQAGELSDERLRLAARLGNEGACQVLEASSLAPTRDNLTPWANELVDAGFMTAFRAILGAAEAGIAQVFDVQPAVVGEVLEALYGYRDAPETADTKALGNVHSRLASPERGGKRTVKRRRSALDTLVGAAAVACAGRRWARRNTILALETTESLIGAEATFKSVSEGLLPWVLSGSSPLVDPAVDSPELLLVVKDTFSIRGRGTILLPDVELPPGDAALKFRVELRRGDGTTERCLASASIPRTTPYTPQNNYVLLVPLERKQVQIGTEVWEVGP